MHGSAEDIDIEGSVSASIEVDKEIGLRYKRKGKWREFGVAIDGSFTWDGTGQAPVIKAGPDDADGFLLSIEGDALKAGKKVNEQPIDQQRITTDDGIDWGTGTPLAT